MLFSFVVKGWKSDFCDSSRVKIRLFPIYFGMESRSLLHLTSGVFTCEDTKSQPQTRKPGQSYKSNYTWTKRRSGKRKGNPPPFIYPAPCRMKAAGSQAGRALSWVDSSPNQPLLHCDSTVNTHASRWSWAPLCFIASFLSLYSPPPSSSSTPQIVSSLSWCCRTNFRPPPRDRLQDPILIAPPPSRTAEQIAAIARPRFLRNTLVLTLGS